MSSENKKTVVFEASRKSGTPSARKGVFVGAAAAALLMMAVPALAETCTPTAVTLSPGGGTVTNGGFIAGAVSGTAANIQSGIVSAQTAFLVQSTAFVSAPSNPAPDQQGSGVWVRSVGGVADLQAPSTTAINVVTTGSAAFNGTATATCDTAVHSTFAGVQFGHDVARLNHNGWNIHFGTTAGYLETKGNTIGGSTTGGAFTSTIQTPFAGAYLVAQKGSFFADALIRSEYYEANFNAPGVGISNQSLNAHGWTFAASAGYNYAIPNTRWFIEPSAGVIASRTLIDNFNLGGIPGIGNGVARAISFADVKSLIGRAGFRVGTTIAQGDWVWQPFAAASVWHEFGDASTATSHNSNSVIGGFPTVINAVTTGTTIGTFGQYSLGIAGQNVNGWVAFVRGDYRKGSQFESWDGTGGVRYHFTPEAPIPVIGKALKAPPMVAAVNWTGFYIGGSAGADFARSKMDLNAGANTPNPRGGGFIGGAQLGYNYQFRPMWVAGVEGTIDWTNLNGAKECVVLPQTGFPPGFNTTCEFDSNWLATLTGRLGYVWGRALWYAKLGVAATRQTVDVRCNVTAAAATAGASPCLNAAGVAMASDGVASGSTDRIGVTASYGLEYALTARWSARAETSYYGFGSRSATLSDGVVASNKYNIISTKIGVNYKLSGPR